MIDRTTWMQKEVPPKPKPVSNKILGIGVILAGGVILAVALIIGLEFPRHVREKVRDDQCILGEHHFKYQEWTEDEFLRRYVRIYYWVITNRDEFLFDGKEPKVQQKGPYVYKTTQRKVDVQFTGQTTSYAVMTSQEFQHAMTKQECGRHCSESDLLTIINDSLLKKITEFKGDGNFFLSLIPNLMKEVYSKLLQDYHGDAAQVYALLGSLYPEGDFATGLGVELTNISFGSWIGKNNTDYKSRILSSRNQSRFTAEEMKGLYTVLSDERLLGVTQLQLTLPLDVSTSGQPSMPNSEENDTICGLLYLLRKTHTNFQEALEKNYTASIQDVLCKGSEQCFNITLSGDGLAWSYVNAILHFIEHVMCVITTDEFLSLIYNQVTITMPQKQLALGYQSSSLAGREFTPGILAHNDGVVEMLDSIDRITVTTCVGKRDISTNMQIVGYSSSRFNFHSDSVRGFYDFTPVLPSLKACVPCVSPLHRLQFYIQDLRRPVWFHRVGESERQGVHATRYQMSMATFYPGQTDVTAAGLLNVTRFTSHLSWFSPPYFYGFEDNVSTVDLPPNTEDHTSSVDVEDITGRVWRRVVRLQYNVGLEDEMLKTLRSLRLKLTYFFSPIPVYWIEEFSEINPLQVEYYHYKVTRLMTVSCGGLIGICIIAIVVVAIGVVITFVPLGLGRVAPMPNDIELQSQ